MPCYGFGGLHYILPKGSSFSVLGGLQNVTGTNLSSHRHFCGGYATSILSILNAGYGTWKVVDVKLCKFLSYVTTVISHLCGQRTVPQFPGGRLCRRSGVRFYLCSLPTWPKVFCKGSRRLQRRIKQ